MAGSIQIGGYDLRDIPLDVLRGHLIGYISQEPQIFNTTIRENIRFGRLNATDVEVRYSALTLFRLTNVQYFIIPKFSSLMSKKADVFNLSLAIISSIAD